MKNSVRKPLYQSTYPLRAIIPSPVKSQSQFSQSPYLRSILEGKSRMSVRDRVIPLISPYMQRPKPVQAPKESKVLKDIEMIEKNWFSNYE
jgi:hypothetical protein